MLTHYQTIDNAMFGDQTQPEVELVHAINC